MMCNSRAFSAAAEEDLFNALQEAIQEDNLQLPTNFTNIMASWSRQKGFPVLTVQRNYPSTVVTVSQQRYLSNPSTTQDPTLWWIPYNLATASSSDFDDTTATHWISDRTQNITVANISDNDWLIVNKRVNVQELHCCRIQTEL